MIGYGGPIEVNPQADPNEIPPFAGVFALIALIFLIGYIVSLVQRFMEWRGTGRPMRKRTKVMLPLGALAFLIGFTVTTVLV